MKRIMNQPIFRQADLPIISIPSPFQTKDSASEFDTTINCETESASRRSTASTTVTASLVAAFIFEFAPKPRWKSFCDTLKY